MATVLTMLYPHGYTVRENPVAGSIDMFGVLAVEEDVPKPFDGTASTSDTLFVSGWAIDPQYEALAAGVIVTLGDACVEADYGSERPDVGRSFGNERLSASGFRGVIAPRPDDTGPHEVRVLAVGIDGRTLFPIGSRPVSIVAGSASLQMGTLAEAEFAAFDITAGRGGRAQRGETFEVSGWAYDRRAGSSIRGVFLVVDGVNVTYGAVGKARPSIADGIADRPSFASGFKIRFDTFGLTMGSHRLQIGFVSADGALRQIVDLAEALEILSPLAC